MEQEILALNAAVLSRTPSHTPPSRGMTRQLADLRGTQCTTTGGLDVPGGFKCPVFSGAASHPASTFGQCKTRAQARGCCSGGAAGRQRRSCGSGGRRAPGAQPASRAQAAAQEQGARLVLSFHPLRSAPKPRHSLIKSSLVVSHRHKAIKMKALMDLSCCEARGAPKPVLGRGEGPRHLLEWPQGVTRAGEGTDRGERQEHHMPGAQHHRRKVPALRPGCLHTIAMHAPGPSSSQATPAPLLQGSIRAYRDSNASAEHPGLAAAQTKALSPASASPALAVLQLLAWLALITLYPKARPLSNSPGAAPSPSTLPVSYRHL